MTDTYIEKRKRGFFGWVFLLIFIAWNVIMVIWLGAFAMHVDEAMQGATTQAEKTGTEIGTGMGVAVILFVWCAGAVITGLLALLTRGSKTIIVRKG